MAKHSKYQQRVIKDYYKNREAIAVQRLQEQVTELYLAEGKKRAKLWQTAEDLMTRLNVPKSRIAHVVASDDAAILAEVEAWHFNLTAGVQHVALKTENILETIAVLRENGAEFLAGAYAWLGRAGILEAIDYYDFFGDCAPPHEREPA